MGTVYCGPYADAIGYDDHEGYAVRILPDGTETGTWTYVTREFQGYRPGCACGWTSELVHPATEAGEDAALDDWDRGHLRPLIQEEARRHLIPADAVLGLVRELRGAVAYTVDEYGTETLTDRSRGLVDAAERLEDLLDDLARRKPPTHRSPVRSLA